NINDSLGHDSGDKALIEFAQSLSRIFPSEIVGRIGGDEFLVYCQKYTNKEDLVNKLLDVSKVFALPSMEKYQKCSVSCSIGVAIHPDDGDDFATLFKKADSALYFSKRNGKNRFTIYSENHIDHID
ncbi:MAG: GGDEF domain-containing protein, partial [Anaerovoracaceae bacterium]